MAEQAPTSAIARLKSRKFWVTLLVIVLVAFTEQLGLNIDPDKIVALVGMASSYVLGQSYVDRRGAQSEILA